MVRVYAYIFVYCVSIIPPTDEGLCPKCLALQQLKLFRAFWASFCVRIVVVEETNNYVEIVIFRVCFTTAFISVNFVFRCTCIYHHDWWIAKFFWHIIFYIYNYTGICLWFLFNIVFKFKVIRKNINCLDSFWKFTIWPNLRISWTPFTACNPATFSLISWEQWN